MESFKRLATDILGVILILAAVPLAWIPGPGGLPLFLAGLGLLSINHHWARRLLERAKAGGMQVSSLLLRENRWWQFSIDLLGLGSVLTAIWLFLSVDTLALKALGVSLMGIGIYLLLANRQRLIGRTKQDKEQ